MAEDLVITLGLKDKNVNKQITSLNKEIRYLDKEFKKTNKTTGDYEKGTAKLEKRMGMLEKKKQAVNLKLDAYKKKTTETTQALRKKEEELVKLESSEVKNEKAIEKCKNQIQKYKDSLKDSERAINSTESELEDLNQELKKTQGELDTKHIKDFQHEMNQLGKELEEEAQKLQMIGGGLDKLGSTMIALGAPIALFAGYAIKATADFEEGMAKVQSISGATGEELEQLKEKAKQMGRDTKFSATQSAEAMSYMAMAGWKANQMIDGLDGVMNLAAASGEDLALVSDIVTDAMTAFGLQAKDSAMFADLLAAASSNSNTNVAMLGESFKYVAPVMGAMKYDAKDTAIALGLMANSGIKASQSGTALRSALVNMAKPTDKMQIIMDRYNLSLKKSDGTMKSFREVMDMLRNNMGGLEEQTLAAASAQLFGKTAMAGMMSVITASEADYQKLTNAIDGSSGSAKEMADIMNKTAKGQLTLLMSKLEGLGIQVGENLLPHVNSLIDHLGELIDWFSNLDEGTQQTIIYFGLMSVATGGLLKVVGKTISGYGALKGAIGKALPTLAKATKGTGALQKSSKLLSGTKGIGGLIKNFKLFSPAGAAMAVAVAGIGTAMAVSKTKTELYSKSAITAKEDLSGFEKVVSDFTGTTFKSREELEKAHLVNKEFANGVRKEFISAVEDAESQMNDFRTILTQVGVDDVLTKEESKSFKKRVEDLTLGAIDVVTSNTEEHHNALKKMFSTDGVLSETEKQTLKGLSEVNSKATKEIEKAQAEIEKILKGSLSNKGKLQDEERDKLISHLEKIKRIELEAMGLSQVEQDYMRKEFHNRLLYTTGEEASEILKAERKAIEERKIQTANGYDEQIIYLQSQLKNMSDEKRKAAEKEITNLENEKLSELQKEDKYWQDVLTMYTEKTGEKGEIINKFNGEILTQQDLQKQEELLKLQEKYDELNSITQTGLYSIWDASTSTYKDIAVVVDESTGEIIGAYDYANQKVGGYTEGMCEDVTKLATENTNATMTIKAALEQSGYSFDIFQRSVKDSTGKTIANLEDVQVEADGTGVAILNLNGKRVKIETNSNGTVKDMQGVIKKLEEATGSAKTLNDERIYIKSNMGKTKEEVDKAKKSMDKAADAIINASKQKLDIKDNAGKVKEKVDNLKTSINNLPNSKTVTIYQNTVKSSSESRATPKNNGTKSFIPAPSLEGAVLGSISTRGAIEGIPSVPISSDIPVTYNNMITSPSFYNEQKQYHKREIVQKQRKPSSVKENIIDANALGKILAEALKEGLGQLIIENIVNASLDGKALTTEVSKEVVRRVKRKR